ncbi:VOC family protein [Streptomyces sp. NPDC057445]|uniref:VOC family protein n=1 Tax=Streptomyces sp. NPDC057445 TaxID=3346136 RepID=UPI0036B4D799
MMDLPPGRTPPYGGVHGLLHRPPPPCRPCRRGHGAGDHPVRAARLPGGAPEPFGTGNTHADFPRSFLELVARTEGGPTGRLPADARLVPLEAPPEALPGLVERIRETSANVAEYLERFEGLHILMFSSPGIDAAAARLSEAGVATAGGTGSGASRRRTPRPIRPRSATWRSAATVPAPGRARSRRAGSVSSPTWTRTTAAPRCWTTPTAPSTSSRPCSAAPTMRWTPSSGATRPTWGGRHSRTDRPGSSTWTTPR